MQILKLKLKAAKKNSTQTPSRIYMLQIVKSQYFFIMLLIDQPLSG